MQSFLRLSRSVPVMSNSPINVEALKSEIRSAVITAKANACPMVVRLAWHASGTYDKADGSGGSNGATMRFEPESTDGANAGLHIIKDMLHLVKLKQRHPEVSHADLWTLAGVAAIEFMGGPKVPFNFGRTDLPRAVPPNGRLPDASQGAAHLRQVFYRMGFNDQEIVALSGGHTLGSCHSVRSGYDGPWTRQPLKFDNTYFKNLLYLEWRVRKWDGPLQYEDAETGELMMLPTDLVLIEDPKFKEWVVKYAKDEQLFFDHFAQAFSRLIAAGCPAEAQPNAPAVRPPAKVTAGLKFREAAMHGSLSVVQKWADVADVHEVEASSGRTALHKAAFWGHVATVDYLVSTLKLNPNARDYNGDTPLHDAVRFGHDEVVKILYKVTDLSIKNNEGLDVVGLARQYGKDRLAALLQNPSKL